METIGSLCDQLSIAVLRKMHCKDEMAIFLLKQQEDSLIQEMDHVLGNLAKGDIPIEMACKPKLKNYKHQDNTLELKESLGQAMSALIEANNSLWNLEDTRRDKSKTDQERLAAADNVSIWNKKRNDMIDCIDNIVSKTIKQFGVKHG